jgi:hypothetical protein
VVIGRKRSKLWVPRAPLAHLSRRKNFAVFWRPVFGVLLGRLPRGGAAYRGAVLALLVKNGRCW